MGHRPMMTQSIEQSSVSHAAYRQPRVSEKKGLSVALGRNPFSPPPCVESGQRRFSQRCVACRCGQVCKYYAGGREMVHEERKNLCAAHTARLVRTHTFLRSQSLRVLSHAYSARNVLSVAMCCSSGRVSLQLNSSIHCVQLRLS